jgi:ectoine hydroxylase-related dioxygenase (phytanoyl-CoA dioxygenase family)
MQLTREQIERFDRDGYLVIPDLLTAEDVAQLQHETADYHDTLARPLPPGVDVTWEPGANPPRVQQVLNAECLSDTLAHIIRSPRVRSVVEPLLGPDVGLFHVKFIMKSPAVGGPVPWHQDYAYWTDHADAPLQLNCMVYLDDADEQNGCLQVLAGSQRSGLETHADTTKGSFVHELDVSAFAGDVVSLPGKAGTGIVFGALLKHASPPNRSAKPRRSFTAVYSTLGSGHPVRQVYWTRQKDGAAIARALEQCPEFSGEGPHGGQCAGGYRRRELWKLATAATRSVAGSWVEVITSPNLGESLEWFAAHRPQDAPLVRFDYQQWRVGTPGVSLHQPSGLAGVSDADVKAHVHGPLALLHMDGGGYLQIRKTLDAFAPLVQRGTAIVVDRFYDADGTADAGADALLDAARDHRWHLDAAARSDRALVAIVRDLAAAGLVTVQPDSAWVPTASGLQFGAQPAATSSDTEPDEKHATPETSEPALRRARRAAGSIKRAFGFTGEWEKFFPIDQIPQVVGEGPRRVLCPTHARRRELWRYALTLIADPSLPWCEFGVGEGESLDWFLLNKPAGNTMFGFDTFEGIPEPWLGHPIGHWKSEPYRSNRSDLEIVRAPFEVSLGDTRVRAPLARGIGLLHVDCDLHSSTHTVLEGTREFLKAGTVVVFDEFYGYGGWQQCEAGAFREFVEAEKVSFEYVARSDFQVAIRLLSIGERASWHVRPLSYSPLTPAIDMAAGPTRVEVLRTALAQLRG